MAIYYGSNPVSVNTIVEKPVYVEVPEGSTIEDMSTSNTVAISPEQFEQLQDGIGYRVSDYVQRTIPQMISRLHQSYFVNRSHNLFPNFQSQQWIRPQGWPNLDSLNLQMSGDDYIYMTYDNTNDRAAIAWHIEKVTNGQNINVTIGHISNGTYTPIETITGTSNNYVRWLTDTDDDYPVVRITGDIKVCYSYNVTNNGVTQYYRRQPVLERIAYVPHLTTFCTSYSTNAWGMFTLQREKIGNGDGTALTSLYYAWAYCRELEDLDISNLRTPNITSLVATFVQNYKLNELDLHHLIVKKVTNMDSLFSTCKALRKLDLTTWETNALTNMNNLFTGCLSLYEIKGIESFNTTNVTTMASTFANCRSLTNLDLTYWNTAKVTSLASCFNGCYSINELNLSTWDISKVTNMSSTFLYCYNLKRIKLTGTTGILTSIYSIFSNCWALETIDAQVLQITSACKDMCYAFSNCWSVKTLNVTGWDVSGLSSNNNCGHSIFNNCYSLENIIGIESFRFQHANSMTNMFANCYSLKNLNLSNWTVSNTTSLASAFTNCYSLTSLNVSSWDVSNCTTLASMFSGCISLTTVGNISNWDTSKCTTIAGMFRYCYSLKEFPAIQTWDLSLVTSIDSIFSECYSFKSVTWTNVSLPVCTNMNQIFRYDYNLKYANLSGWSIPSVANNTSYYHTFGDCQVLRDIIGFPIPSTYTNLGFQNCENLSYTSLLTIVNSLPQVTGTHTLRIPALSLNLLDATEKAIATNKGWTLANS